MAGTTPEVILGSAYTVYWVGSGARHRNYCGGGGIRGMGRKVGSWRNMGDKVLYEKL